MERNIFEFLGEDESENKGDIMFARVVILREGGVLLVRK